MTEPLKTTCTENCPIPCDGSCSTQPTDVLTFGPVKLRDMLAPRLQGRFRYCKQLGWLAFTGAKWEQDADTAVMNEVVETVKDYTLQLVKACNGNLSREQCSELASFSGAQVQNHAVKLARGADGIRAEVQEFDPQPEPGKPWLLPCSNGWTIELHSNGVKVPRKTKPEDMNTHAGCAYDPEAKAPAIAAAFAQYQEDVTVRQFLMQMWMRGLSGLGAEKFLVNLGESGRNGKGTMQALLTTVAGDYAAELPVEVILKGNNNAREVFRSELAQLRGARLVFSDEPEEGTRYNLGVLKKITGGNDIQGRGMGKEAIKFEGHWVYQLAANNRPSWGTDGGMEQRYVEIAWNFQVDKSTAREDFKTALKAEASGFLNALLDQWVGNKPVTTPESVAAQTAAGAKAASPVAKFVEEALEESPGKNISARILYQAYEEWCRQSGPKPVSSTKFGKEMPRTGIEKAKNGTVSYLNVTIKDEYEPRASRY